MQTAYIWAARSTCSRLHVGAVIAREGRILVQGYNGAPAGMPHCDHTCDCVLTDHGTHYADCNSAQPCTVSQHAEKNAIAWAARVGVALEGAELFVTHQPCLECAMMLVNAGIDQVWFVEPYRLKDGLDFLNSAGIDVGGIIDFPIPKR